MLKSACASFPTWLLNVRDLTHLMSFLSFWKFFPESLPCLLMCCLTERRGGSWCTWTWAPGAGDSDPASQKGLSGFFSLQGSCWILPGSEYSGLEGEGGGCRSEVAVAVRRTYCSVFALCFHEHSLQLPSASPLALLTCTPLPSSAHLVGRETKAGTEFHRCPGQAGWAKQLSIKWPIIPLKFIRTSALTSVPDRACCPAALAALEVSSLLIFFPPIR